MKKYLKMTFAALSAIALNFSCLATSQPPRHHVNNEINTLNNRRPQLQHIDYRPITITPLSTNEQMSLLFHVIEKPNLTLAKLILKGCIGKRDQQHYSTQREGSFAVIKSEQQFEELQLFSLHDLRNPKYSTIAAANATKIKIFELITSKFFEVANNKEYAYQTTASKIYPNLDILKFEFGALIDLFPSDDSKRAFVRQLLNYAKQENNIKENIKKSGDIFWRLQRTYFVKDIPTPSFSIFQNQDWLQSFIREYLEQALRDDIEIDIPIIFIKEVAPDLYQEKITTFIEKGIVEIDKDSIDLLLPLDENNLPCNALRLPSKYLDLALNCLTCMNRNEYNEEDFPNDRSKDIFYSVALYTNTSDLTDVALTLTNFHQKKRQRALEIIRDVNSGLHNLLLEEILLLNAMNFQLNRPDGLSINEVIQGYFLSSDEQISLLKNAILSSEKTLVEKILNGYIGKIDSKYYYMSTAESEQEDFFTPMSDQQFEGLQRFSLNDLGCANDDNKFLETKREIFELITSKFYEVTNNKEQAYQTTASKIYSNLDSFATDELGEVVDLIPSDDGKRAFAKQLLNDAKRYNNIDKYGFIFFSLGEVSETNIFHNQAWLLQFINEYLEQELSDTTDINLEDMPMDLKEDIVPDIYNENFPVYINLKDMPIDFIKEVAPDLYNEKFPALLKKGITDGATDVIGTLLPRDDRNNKNIPLEDRRLSAEYLNLALEKYHSGKILSHVASYTDISSDLKDVALTLTNFTQEERQETLEGIKDANINLYYPLVRELLRRLWN